MTTRAAVRATLKVGEYTLDLPEQEATTLFMAAAYATEIVGALIISPDTTVIVNAGTQISLTIPGRFAHEYNPDSQLDAIRERHKKQTTKHVRQATIN